MNQHTSDYMSITDAKEALSVASKLYFAKDSDGNYRVKRRRARPLCLMGPAGIGKTEIVSQVAEEQGLALCSYSLVHHTRQSLLGLPRLETVEMMGKESSCTRYTMSEIIDAIYQTMEETGKKQGILFLDEFNCVNESIRPVMLQLLQEKALGTHEIPAGWMLVLAGNPTQYNKSARDLDAVTMDRLRILNLEANLNAWMPYAKKSGVHPVIIDFLQENPQFFYVYQGGTWEKTGELITPRGWEDMSIQLALMEEIGEEITPLFLAQFFQSNNLVHHFYMFYRRYGVLAGNGLLDSIFQRELTSIASIQALSTQDRWALVTAISSRVRNIAMAVVEEENLLDKLYALLKANRSVLKEGGAEAIEKLYLLAGADENQACREALLGCADVVGEENGWQDIVTHFQNKLVEPLKLKKEQAFQTIDNGLFLCNQALTDAENVERLLHGMVDHKETALFIASGSVPAFQEMCINTQFQDSGELEQIKKQMEAVS